MSFENNMLLGKKGREQERGWEGMSMRGIVQELMQEAESLTVNPREYVISGDVSSEELRSLVDLPVEVYITSLPDGRLNLGTGTEVGAIHEMGASETWQKIKNSPVAFHTHPLVRGIIGDMPSLADFHAQLSRQREGFGISTIGHPNGLVAYTFHFNSEAMSGALSEWELMLGELRRMKDEAIDWDEVMQKQREFARRSGGIVAQAAWEDKEGIRKIMDFLTVKAKK